MKNLIKDILQLLVDDNELYTIKEQLKFIEISKTDYTGQGVFVRFKQLPGIDIVKNSREELVISGVEITSSQLLLGGQAVLFISKGFIDYLEIWSHNGEYPRLELKDYILKQVWQGSPGRQISSVK